MRRHESSTCSVEGCDGSPVAKGLCGKHYKAARRALLPRQRALSRPPHPCAATGCTRITTREYCDAHEQKLRRYGDANHVFTPKNGGPCPVEGCDRQATTGGMCASHHLRQQKYGDATAGRKLLSEKAIADIRMNPDGWTVERLARKHRTTLRTVIAVRRGRNWGHLLD